MIEWKTNGEIFISEYGLWNIQFWETIGYDAAGMLRGGTVAVLLSWSIEKHAWDIKCYRDTVYQCKCASLHAAFSSALTLLAVSPLQVCAMARKCTTMSRALY